MKNVIKKVPKVKPQPYILHDKCDDSYHYYESKESVEFRIEQLYTDSCLPANEFVTDFTVYKVEEVRLDIQPIKITLTESK